MRKRGTSSRVFGAWMLGGLIASSGCSEDHAGERPTRAVGVELRVANGVRLDSLTYVVSEGGRTVQSATVDVRGPEREAQLTLSALPSGAYDIAVSGRASNGRIYSGSTALAVAKGETVTVSLAVRAVRGALDVDVGRCPTLRSIVAEPDTTTVGSEVRLKSAASGGRLRFAWSASSGTITDQNRRTASYRCTSAGQPVISLSVSNDDCAVSRSITLTCTSEESGGGGGAGGAPAACEGPLVFPDPKLDAAVHEAVGKPEGPLYPADVATLSSLSVDYNGPGPQSLEGIECLPALRNLYFDSTNLGDIAPVQALTRLTSLFVLGGPFADPVYYDGLVNLQVLGLNSSEIRDLSPLRSLTRLTRLQLGWNGRQIKVSDFGPLAALADLSILSMSTSYPCDLTPLSGLSRLSDLQLRCDAIVDLAPIAGLSALALLNLSMDHVGDVSALAGLVNLRLLELAYNDITDIAPLAGLSGLERLSLNVNSISDVSALTGLTRLQDVRLGVNRITDIAPLVQNSGFGPGDSIDLSNNPLDCATQTSNVEALLARGVGVVTDCEVAGAGGAPNP